jgi:hypothetical protein
VAVVVFHQNRQAVIRREAGAGCCAGFLALSGQDAEHNGKHEACGSGEDGVGRKV